MHSTSITTLRLFSPPKTLFLKIKKDLFQRSCLRSSTSSTTPHKAFGALRGSGCSRLIHLSTHSFHTIHSPSCKFHAPSCTLHASPCTLHASSMHPSCILHAFSMHLPCTLHASSMHPSCTLHALQAHKSSWCCCF